ncbi:hypothetical protein, partial [Pseudoalteromonas sp.]|uniref:hypothetical protein n=1 Tax=Pseudoalteromonas sp. TaxID=53249 RepID=UPI002603E2F0
KEAIKLLSEDKFEEAYKVFPAYPDAYVHHCLSSASMKDINKQIEILEKGMGVCKDNIRIKDQFAKCLFQWDENTQTTYPYYGNNIKRSEKMFLEMAESKPGGEAAFYYLGLINAKYKQDYAQAVKYLKKVVEVNPTKWGEMWNFICQFIREYDDKN